MGQQHPLPKQETGEVYTTGNVLIRRIGERLTRKIGEMLRDIGATERFGLDIGCAEGHLLADLKRQGVIGEVVAVELEFEKITSSVANGTGVRFVQGDAENIGVRSETFEYVMATEVLEHLPHPEKALARRYKAIKHAPALKGDSDILRVVRQAGLPVQRLSANRLVVPVNDHVRAFIRSYVKEAA